MKCTTLEASQQKIDGGGMFANAPKALWSRWFESDDLNRVRLACRALVVETDGRVLLVDAGIGDYMDPKLAGRYGTGDPPVSLPADLARIGISEEQVDFILLTHLHFDHAGGIIPPWPAIESDNWSPCFPNARYVVARSQLERAKNPHPRDRASYIPSLPAALEHSGRLIQIGPGDGVGELDGVLELFFTDGHTPGLMTVLVKGESQRLFFASDLIPGAAWLHLPIVTSFDRYPEALINDKQALLERAVEENWLIVYPHDPDAAASRVTLNEKGRYEARDAMPDLEAFEL